MQSPANEKIISSVRESIPSKLSSVHGDKSPQESSRSRAQNAQPINHDLNEVKQFVANGMYDVNLKFTELREELIDKFESLQKQKLQQISKQLEETQGLKQQLMDSTRKLKVENLRIDESTIKQILLFEELVADYFFDQARDYIKLIEEPFVQKQMLTDKLNMLPGFVMTPEQEKALSANPYLSAKMNSLAWLVRCDMFIAEEQKKQMVQAYRRTVVSIHNVDLTKQYFQQTTSSLAILTVSDLLKVTLEERSKNLKPIKDEEDLMDKIWWPLQVLDLLVCNSEQATIGLRRGRIVIQLGKILRAISNAPESRGGTQIVRWIVRIYSTIMNKVEARSQFKKELGKQLSSLFRSVTKDLSSLPENDTNEMIANLLQAIKLFIQGPESVEEVLNDFPEFLYQLHQIINAYGKNLIIYNEACQILKKFMIKHKASIPEELDDFVANISDSDEELTDPIEIKDSPSRLSHNTIPAEKQIRGRKDLVPSKQVQSHLFQPVVISDERNISSALNENNDYYFNRDFQPYQSQPALTIPQRKRQQKQQERGDQLPQLVPTLSQEAMNNQEVLVRMPRDIYQNYQRSHNNELSGSNSYTEQSPMSNNKFKRLYSHNKSHQQRTQSVPVTNRY